MKHDLPKRTAARDETPPQSGAGRGPGLIAWMQRRVTEWLRRIDSRFGF